MKTNTEALVKAWADRPGMFDPSDHDHLFWVATRLLPALKAAMPSIIRLDASEQETAAMTLAHSKNEPWLPIPPPNRPPVAVEQDPLTEVKEHGRYTIEEIEDMTAKQKAIEASLANPSTCSPAPSTDQQTAPETACNTHSQQESPKTDDSASSGDRTKDIVDTLAYVEPKPHVKLSRAEVMAKMKAGREKAKAARAALHAQQPTTQEPASVDVNS